MAVPAFNFFQRQNTLEAVAQEIISALQMAQNKTLASEGASNFGVHFETNKFVLFKGASYNPASTDNENHNLPNILQISQINLNGGSTNIIFERLTGTTQSFGSIKIEFIDDSSKNVTIFISASGVVGLNASNPSDATRIYDSRHTHFVFSQNTKNASILTLYFPADNFTQEINYQTYLNPAKDEFSWEGIVNVNGANQTLKIHSHGLTDSATAFCLHRDRRQNSKALNIFLDGQNLINYSATGTTTPGTSPWVGIPQLQ